jgi:hypothetical protein
MLLQVAEDLQAQVGERALADPADEVGLRVVAAQTTSALAMNATTTRSSVRRSPARMPESMAVLASGAGASDAGRARHEREEHERHARLVGPEQHHEPAQLAPAPTGAAQAPAQVVAPGRARAASAPEVTGPPPDAPAPCA